jgi:hypothetical protein
LSVLKQSSERISAFSWFHLQRIFSLKIIKELNGLNIYVTWTKKSTWKDFGLKRTWTEFHFELFGFNIYEKEQFPWLKISEFWKKCFQP